MLMFHSFCIRNRLSYNLTYNDLNTLKDIRTSSNFSIWIFDFSLTVSFVNELIFIFNYF